MCIRDSTFPVLSASTKLKPYTATPGAQTSSTTLSNKDVNLGKFLAYEEFDPSIFENHWHQSELSSNLLSRSLPATFSNYLGSWYTQVTFVPIETMIHLGSTTYSQITTGTAIVGGVNESLVHFDGIIKQALNASTPALSVATPVALTSANIIAKMEAAKLLMTTTKGGKALIASGDRYKRLKYIMSVVDAQKYEDALVNSIYKNQNTTEKGINQYKGYEVVVVSGLPENTFYFCEATTDVKSNLHLAVSSMDNISFKIDRLQANSELYFYKAIAKMGAGISKPQEFVIYTTAVLADFSL